MKQQQNTIFMTPLEEPITLPFKFLIECTYCAKEFLINRCEYLKRERLYGSKTYCSRECYNKNRPYRYNHYYYCDSCACWIPQKQAVKNLKFYPTCPKLDCNNNRLRLSAAKAKFTHKRENVKYIE
jgi:hypothetical protein